jgi:hypothetical protein
VYVGDPHRLTEVVHPITPPIEAGLDGIAPGEDRRADDGRKVGEDSFLFHNVDVLVRSIDSRV